MVPPHRMVHSRVGRLRSPRPPKFCPSLQDSRPPPEGLPAPWPSGCFLGSASANTGFLDGGTWGPCGLAPIPTLPSAGPGPVGEEAWGWRAGGLAVVSDFRCGVPRPTHLPEADAPRGLCVREVLVAPWGALTASGRLSPVREVGGSRVTTAPSAGKRTFSGRKAGVLLGRPQSLHWRAACCWDSGEPRSSGPDLLGSPSFLGVRGYCRVRSCVWGVRTADARVRRKRARLSAQEKRLHKNTEASSVMSVPRFSACSGPWVP